MPTLTVSRAEGLALAGFITATVETGDGRSILTAIGTVTPEEADPQGLELRDVGATLAGQFLDGTRSSATVLLTVEQLSLLYQYVAVWIDDTPIEAVVSADTRRALGSFCHGVLAREWRQRNPARRG